MVIFWQMSLDYGNSFASCTRAKEFCMWAKHIPDNKNIYTSQVFQDFPILKKNH